MCENYYYLAAKKYACMYHLPHKKYLQVMIRNIKTDTIQYFKAKNVKGKKHLITVAGIALKCQADLISIMVPK